MRVIETLFYQALEGNLFARNKLIKYLQNPSQPKLKACRKFIYDKCNEKSKSNYNARYLLGILHKNGWNDNEKPDLNTAMDLFYQASTEGNNAWAQNALGEYFLSKKRFEMAFTFFTQSAEQNCEEGILSLAHSYYYGLGTSVDTDKALELLTKAANMGYPNAMVRLVCIFSNPNYSKYYNLENAEKLLDAAIAKNNAEAFYIKSELFPQAKTAEGIDYYSIACKKLGSRGFTTLALQTFRSGDVQRARKLVEIALHLNDNNARAWELKGKLIYELDPNKFDLAVICFDKAIMCDSQLGTPYLRRAEIALLNGNLPLTEYFLKKAQQQNVTEAWSVSAILQMQKNEVSSALESYQKLLSLDKYDCLALNGKGLLLQGQGKVSEALDIFKAALKIDPTNEQTINNFIRILISLEKYEDVIAFLETQSKQLLTHRNLLSLAEAKLQTGHKEEALKLYLQIIMLDPRNPLNWNASGDDNYAPSSTVYQPLYALLSTEVKHNPSIGLYLSYYHYILGSYNKALDVLDSLDEQHQYKPEMWLLKGCVLINLQLYKQAEKSLVKALSFCSEENNLKECIQNYQASNFRIMALSMREVASPFYFDCNVLRAVECQPNNTQSLIMYNQILINSSNAFLDKRPKPADYQFGKIFASRIRKILRTLFKLHQETPTSLLYIECTTNSLILLNMHKTAIKFIDKTLSSLDDMLGVAPHLKQSCHFFLLLKKASLFINCKQFADAINCCAQAKEIKPNDDNALKIEKLCIESQQELQRKLELHRLSFVANLNVLEKNSSEKKVGEKLQP